MLKWISTSALLLWILVALPTGGQEAPVAAFFMPTPEGWRTETIPFPLGFAPELAYEGLEEIRFAPGMFQEGSEDFWSYAFVWWLPIATPLDAETLSTDLESYFRGLTLAVSEANGFDPGEAIFEAAIRPVASERDESGSDGSSTDGRRFSGEVRTFDAFATRKPVELNARIEIWACQPHQRQVVFFEFSPQPPSHAIWNVLHGIREDFRCES